MTQEQTPILGKPSFKCPHCAAIAHQDWYQPRAELCDENAVPSIPDDSLLKEVAEDPDLSQERKIAIIRWVADMRAGYVLFENVDWETIAIRVHNIWLSRCFSCKAVAVWVHERLIFPTYNFALLPSNDLPPDIKVDFIEAAKILDLSPRGSAALLRLCIQKLCMHLGKPGKNLNNDIADLVKEGLNSRIQRSLDIVRVIGNNAVHPGQIDMTDSRDTASKLFRLVNLITDAMITQPKHIDEFYEELPESARQQIEKRDAQG